MFPVDSVMLSAYFFRVSIFKLSEPHERYRNQEFCSRILIGYLLDIGFFCICFHKPSTIVCYLRIDGAYTDHPYLFDFSILI